MKDIFNNKTHLFQRRCATIESEMRNIRTALLVNTILCICAAIIMILVRIL